MYHCNTLSLIIAKNIRAIEGNLLIWLVILGIRSIILRKCSYICPVKVKVAQLCLTLCHPMDLVHGILQARILEWIAFPFSRGSSQPRDRTQVSLIAGRFFTNWATREAHGTSDSKMKRSIFAFKSFPVSPTQKSSPSLHNLQFTWNAM